MFSWKNFFCLIPSEEPSAADREEMRKQFAARKDVKWVKSKAAKFTAALSSDLKKPAKDVKQPAEKKFALGALPAGLERFAKSLNLKGKKNV